MANSPNPLKTFDPEEATKIIKQFKGPETKHVQGSIDFSVDQNFVVLEIKADKELFRGDSSSDHLPSGIFLLFPKHELLQFLKETFDLRAKPET